MINFFDRHHLEYEWEEFSFKNYHEEYIPEDVNRIIRHWEVPTKYVSGNASQWERLGLIIKRA